MKYGSVVAILALAAAVTACHQRPCKSPVLVVPQRPTLADERPHRPSQAQSEPVSPFVPPAPLLAAPEVADDMGKWDRRLAPLAWDAPPPPPAPVEHEDFDLGLVLANIIMGAILGVSFWVKP